MTNPTFLWHDYETTGIDPARDRPSQFAGIRTDMNLNQIGEPVSVLCKPARDNLPHPEAVLLTGIAPQQAEREGLAEVDFAATVYEQLAEPGTCGVGFNSLRFDDAVTRNLLYRNFYDPYEREWRNGNSRWDIIDLARMCYALRPAGIEWPQRDDGSPSFKLEHLAAANGLEQRRAHDAVSDVQATIALARLLRKCQPRMWDWYFKLRNKRAAAAELDIVGMKPVIHVSSRYLAERGCLSMIIPLAQHPTRSNEVIVYDLAEEPSDLLNLNAEDIAERMFTPRADLPEDVRRVALRTVRINQSPALAPTSVLKGIDLARIKLDPDLCMQHAQQLRLIPDLIEKVRKVYVTSTAMPAAADPELALYGGFLPDADKPLLAKVRTTSADQLGTQRFPFRDTRYPELLFRYRARNWPQTLNADEHQRWQEFCRNRLTRDTVLTSLTLDAYLSLIDNMRANPSVTAPQQALLDGLHAWGLEVTHELA